MPVPAAGPAGLPRAGRLRLTCREGARLTAAQTAVG